MDVKLDRFGRVVLPKTLRDDLDLEAGDVLVVEEVDDGILLRPVRDEPGLVEKEGVLVFTGKPTEDVARTLEKIRAGRLRGLLDGPRRRR
ncbi:MAG: AbrB/MazE/SpoVT family DNA-binding domain-containing protein [Vicinamibacteria bacterium]